MRTFISAFLPRSSWLLASILFLPLLAPLDIAAQGNLNALQPFLVPFASGLTQPVHITNAGDGSGRLFVVEQPGRIRVVKNGAVQSVPLLDISSTAGSPADRKVLSGGERGLLSVAFPPGFAQKGYFYVNYTRAPDGATVIARYFVTINPDVANPASEEVILTVSQPFANHNGGQLAFGPDGFLYIGMGDGGAGCDPNNFAQNLGDLPGNHKLLGKLLRIDVESGINPYAIPLTNPLLGGSRSEIWAIGLRNPWRFSFDRQTGDLYIGDVGQISLEEIDFQPASSTGGENYGWNIMEGLSFSNVSGCTPACLPNCSRAGLVLPVAQYDHTLGCSVTGGHVYRGQNYPFMQGVYFYADFCSGRLWALMREGAVWQNRLLLDTPFGITSFGEDEAGGLYATDYLGGVIYRIIDAFAVMPVPAGQQVIPYAASTLPRTEIEPALAKPLGIGPFAEGGAAVNLQVGFGQFGGGVDVYIGLEAPAFDPVNAYVLGSDNTFRFLSQGLVPWRQNITGPLNVSLFGDIPASSLPPGAYTLYGAVTPAGSTDAFYLWITSFAVP